MNVAPYKHRYSKNETTKKRPKVWKFRIINVSLQKNKAQQLIDMQIQEMEHNDAETISIEEAREMTLAAVRKEYAEV